MRNTDSNTIRMPDRLERLVGRAVLDKACMHILCSEPGHVTADRCLQPPDSPSFSQPRSLRCLSGVPEQPCCTAKAAPSPYFRQSESNTSSPSQE